MEQHCALYSPLCVCLLMMVWINSVVITSREKTRKRSWCNNLRMVRSEGFSLDQTLKTSGYQSKDLFSLLQLIANHNSTSLALYLSTWELNVYSYPVTNMFPIFTGSKCQMSSLEDRCWSCSCASKVETKHSSGAKWLASKAEEMMSIITSVLSNAYGSLHDVRTANLIRRGLVLFTVGASLALVLNLLQIQRNVTLFPEEVMTTLFSSAWWIPPCCGTGAGQ